MSTTQRAVIAGLLVALAACAAVLVVLVTWSGVGKRDSSANVVIEQPGRSRDPAAPDDFARDMRILEFSLVDQSGRPVTAAMFEGRVTVIDFFFTTCPFICPMMTARMSALADDLKGAPVRFASFSVDPEHDTPGVLREYASRLGADTARWTFVTGDRETIWRMVEEGFMWGIEERPEEPFVLADGTRKSNIRHPPWFALVGPDGRVLGVYQTDERSLLDLGERARAVARGRGGR